MLFHKQWLFLKVFPDMQQVQGYLMLIYHVRDMLHVGKVKFTPFHLG